MQSLYPLLLERRLVRKIWGGQQLADWLNLPRPYPERLGEIWQVYDTNAIINGPLAGQTLAQVTQRYGAALVGTRSYEDYGNDFPLLVKFLDAADRLSIQVHPGDAHVHETETGLQGKTEAWYILRAEPGATIINGLKEPISPEDFVAAIETGTLEPLLTYQLVKPGDVILVPVGTVHAINPGILLFEIQQKSDLTYRIYDYERVDVATNQPRELHIEQALEVCDLSGIPQIISAPAVLDDVGKRVLLVSCAHFALGRWTIDPDQCRGYRWSTDPASLEILTVISGAGTISWSGGTEPIQTGDSVVVPACLGECCLQATNGNGISATGGDPLCVLHVYVPES